MFRKLSKSYLFFVAAILFAILVWIYSKPLKEKEGDIIHRNFLENLDVHAIVQMEVERESGIQLKKENSHWMVATKKVEISDNPKWYPADEEKVDFLFSTLLDTHITSLVATNPKKHGAFEVGENGIKVKLFDSQGNKIVSFIIGKTGPSFSENYIRKEEENDVYLTDRQLKMHFPTDLSLWRDHTIWKVAPEQIEVVQIKQEKKEWTIEKREKEWVLKSEREKILDPTKVEEFLKKFTQISARDFSNVSLKEAGLNPAKTIISLSTRTGAFTLQIGELKKGTNLYFAKKEGGEEIYFVSEDLIKNMINVFLPTFSR